MISHMSKHVKVSKTQQLPGSLGSKMQMQQNLSIQNKTKLTPIIVLDSKEHEETVKTSVYEKKEEMERFTTFVCQRGSTCLIVTHMISKENKDTKIPKVEQYEHQIKKYVQLKDGFFAI